MELRGTVGLVTGGGTGIGRAVALCLARAGATGVTVVYSRSREEAEGTAAELSALGCEGVAVEADVSSDEDVRRAVTEAAERFGRLDVLVNNAGTTRFIGYHDLDALTDEIWNELLGVNLLGTFYCSRAAAPHLSRARGAIVNVASIAGIRATGSSIAYGVTKAGVLQLTRALAFSLAPDVRVNAVAPGLVATRWHRDRLGNDVVDGLEEQIGSTTPLGAVATPDDVADAVLALVAADFVTGETVVVDGGRSLAY